MILNLFFQYELQPLPKCASERGRIHGRFTESFRVEPVQTEKFKSFDVPELYERRRGVSWKLSKDAKDVTFKISQRLWNLVTVHAGHEGITVQELMDCLLRYHFSTILEQVEVARHELVVGLESHGS